MKVLSDEGDIYDADCGQEICCNTLPKYLNGQNLEDCYLEISKIVQGFVDERIKAQLKDAIRQFKEMLDGIENPYLGFMGSIPSSGENMVPYWAFDEAIQTIKQAIKEEK